MATSIDAHAIVRGEAAIQAHLLGDEVEITVGATRDTMFTILFDAPSLLRFVQRASDALAEMNTSKQAHAAPVPA